MVHVPGSHLPGGFQIQPAELAKIAIIIGMSMILSERTHDSNEPTSKDVFKHLAIAAIPVLLIILQPDMGTILIIAAAVVTIIAVSGAPARWVAGLLLLAVLGGFVAVKAGVVSEYQVNRLQTFVDPNADTQGAGYQLATSTNHRWFWWLIRNWIVQRSTNKWSLCSRTTDRLYFHRSW